MLGLLRNDSPALYLRGGINLKGKKKNSILVVCTIIILLGMINFTVNDSRIILTRKLLLTEQFHDERVRKLATKHFLGGTEKIFTVIFEKMIDNGLLKDEDPEMLAFVYTAPITSLIHLCDRESQKQSEAIEQMKKFIRHFIKIYGVEV